MKKVIFLFMCISVLCGIILYSNSINIKNNNTLYSSISPTDSEWENSYIQICVSNITEIDKIKALISLYFKANYEGLKRLEYQDISFMTLDNKSNSDETVLRKIHIEKIKSLNDHYANYKIYLDYKDIELNSNFAKINIIIGCDFNYASNLNEISSKRGDEHIIELVKQDGLWKISSDIYKDTLMSFIKNNYNSPQDYLNQLEKQEK